MGGFVIPENPETKESKRSKGTTEKRKHYRHRFIGA
jgi:hypothetical protein